MSFRSRLILSAMVTLAVGLGALLVTGNVLLDRRVSAEASSLLRARAEAEIAALSISDRGVEVRETANDTVLDRRSWVLAGPRVVERPPGAPAPLDQKAVALGRAGRATEVSGPSDTRLLVRPLRTSSGRQVGTVVVATSLTSLERLQQEVLIGSLVLAALVLLAGWLAIRSAVDGALKPVSQMTASAEDWSAHDLDQRFGLGPPRDELTGLAATLDQLLGRIAASRRHEQRFAEDAAHELRTPLARMRGNAELALGRVGPGADDERRVALKRVVVDADELDRAVQTLLDVARSDAAAGSPQGVDLAAVAGSFPGIEVQANAPVASAEGNPEVVRRALAPLIENAQRHSQHRVWVEVRDAGDEVVAAVCDDGPGIPAELREKAFEPGVRGDGSAEDGAGLGLALARRLARSCGGDVAAVEGRGGRVELRLPRLAG